MRKFLTALVAVVAVVGCAPSASAAPSGTVVNRCAPELRQPVVYEDVNTPNPLGLRGALLTHLTCGHGDSGVRRFTVGNFNFYITAGTSTRCVQAGTWVYPQGLIYVTPTSLPCSVRVPYFRAR